MRNWNGNPDNGIRDTGIIAPATTVSGSEVVRIDITITSLLVGRRSDFGYFKYIKP